jgi:hypothetical protein
LALTDVPIALAHVCFSNRPFWVKRFQTIHHYSVDVARGLALLFGIGTEALPAWDSVHIIFDFDAIYLYGYYSSSFLSPRLENE